MLAGKHSQATAMPRQRVTADPALKLGQEKLTELGYYAGALDGHYEAITATAIIPSGDSTVSAAPEIYEKTLHSDTALVELPTIFAQLISELKAGTTVQVLATEKAWLTVEHGEGIGYISPQE